MDLLHEMNGKLCSCGKVHSLTAKLITGKGVLARLPEQIRLLGGTKVYLLSDRNTWLAAGEKTASLLAQNGIAFVSHCFPDENLEPDEKSVGSAVMHYDHSCDLILCVGSGVLNDIAKILKAMTGKPYIIVGTAPSMDGYASSSSSMTRDGLKISLNSACADVILGDTEILCQAPLEMMRSGLGDMIAKYVSICEWRIAHLITGEYYCEQVAQLVRQALQRCVDGAQGLMNREESAVQSVFEGLVICGAAMHYAGLSRPASGVEHYISHVLDMRGAEFGAPVRFHGIQCAVGTLIAVRLYEKLKTVTPDREKALAYAAAFDAAHWQRELRSLLGKGAEAMIRLEEKEQKYDRQKHAQRLDVILQNWPQILCIIDQELPSGNVLESLLDTVGAPKTLSQLGTQDADLPVIFRATKDIRDKYVLSRLAWDLGILDELFD